MPGDIPQFEDVARSAHSSASLGLRDDIRTGGLKAFGSCKAAARRCLRAARAALTTGCSSLAMAAVFNPLNAIADPVREAAHESISFNSTEIMLLAVFGGAMSFAMMSASWLIRERARITSENANLHLRLADLRASNERSQALINSSDQRIVVWDGDGEAPTLIGSLSSASGAPAARNDFLSFGRWLDSSSAVSFEGSLNRLRKKAEAFDMPLVTRSGGVIEAQGRTSGSHAFVRFVELSGERLALSHLEAEHTKLLSTMDMIRGLFDTVNIPFWLKDAHGQLFWVNSAYANAVDSPDGETAVNRGLQLLDSAERTEVERQERTQGRFSGSLPAIVSGDRRMLEIAEVRTEAGFAGLGVDRSEVEAVRATLKQTIASHAQTLDHLATAVAMFDSRQCLQFYNSAFQKLWHLAPGFLDNHPTNAQVLDSIRAEKRLSEMPDWRKWREQQLEIYRALEAREDWWYLPGGQTLRVIANPHPQGGVTWVFENVTEQLALESNYNALIRVQGETLDNLSEAVAVFGSDGKLRLCNPAFASFFVLDQQLTVPGTHISDLSRICARRLTQPDSWDDIEDAITSFDDTRGDLSARLETVDGKIYDTSLVRLPEGQTMLAVGDMTAAVNVERALKERNEALEQSDTLKNRFIQHVSYELRAPLTSISGFSEMLGLDGIGSLNEKQTEYVGHISASSQVLKSIIDDILDLATIDAGALTLEPEPCNVQEITDEVFHAFNDKLSDRGIRPQASIARDAAQIVADPDRLRQILSNLVANAISFSPDGAMVTVASARKGGNLEISVIDEGPGVPPGERQRIFGRFESRSTANRRKGTGLGLSVVKSFVELHGGSVRVEDAEKRGARFVCVFPIARSARKEAA
ncbi:MAG: ATP-binding protein [Rhizobiaceae bacterium]